jgi:hypothetical protein
MQAWLQQPVICSSAAFALGVLASLLGGALVGMTIGGKQFGWQLAIQMGGLFGMLAGIPGVAIAFVALALIG